MASEKVNNVGNIQAPTGMYSDFLQCTDAGGEVAWAETKPWREGMTIARLVTHNSVVMATIHDTLRMVVTHPETGIQFGLIPLSLFHWEVGHTAETTDRMGSSDHSTSCGCSKAVGTLLYRVLKTTEDTDMNIYEPIGVVRDVLSVSTTQRGDVKENTAPDEVQNRPQLMAVISFVMPLIFAAPVSSSSSSVLDNTAETSANAKNLVTTRPTHSSIYNQWGERIDARRRWMPDTSVYAVSTEVLKTTQSTTDKTSVNSSEMNNAATSTQQVRISSVMIGVLMHGQNHPGHIAQTVAHLFDARTGDATGQFIYRRLTGSDKDGGNFQVYEPIAVVIMADHKRDALLMHLFEHVAIPARVRADGSKQTIDLLPGCSLEKGELIAST